MPNPVTDILETCLYVDDLSAAEAFYTQILGLTIDSKTENRHIFFRCGNRMLLLFNLEVTSEVHDGPHFAPAHGSTGSGHVAFAIGPEELNHWRHHLTSHNVEIEKEIQWGERGHSIYFRDPAGNSLEVTLPAIWGIDQV
jgi:catechol 2,3-dioxygenase-like lactoylglutathione lyase family enzyme